MSKNSKLTNVTKQGEPMPVPARRYLLPWSRDRFRWVIAQGKKPEYRIDWHHNVITLHCDGNPLTIAKLAGCAGESIREHAIYHPEELGKGAPKRWTVRPLPMVEPVPGAYRVQVCGHKMFCPHCGGEYANRGTLAKHLVKVHNDVPTAMSIDVGLQWEAAKRRVKVTGIKKVGTKGVRHAD